MSKGPSMCVLGGRVTSEPHLCSPFQFHLTVHLPKPEATSSLPLTSSLTCLFLIHLG